MQRADFDLVNLAAIVSISIHKKRLPISYGARDFPIDSQDSGWQFHEDVPFDPNVQEAKIWTLGEVFEYEPSLGFILKLAPRVIVRRENPFSTWVIGEWIE